MKIVDILEIDNKKYACIQGDDLICGMIISKVSTPFGIIAVKGSPVKEACFCPGRKQGMREMGTLLGQLKIVIWLRRAGVSSCRESRHRFLYDSCNCL